MRSSTEPSADRISTGVCLPFLRSMATMRQPVEMRQLPVGDDEVVAALGGAEQAFAPVGGDVHHVAAFTQPLGKEPGGFRVVLDQQQVHEVSKLARAVEFTVLRIINIHRDYGRRVRGRLYSSAPRVASSGSQHERANRSRRSAAPGIRGASSSSASLPRERRVSAAAYLYGGLTGCGRKGRAAGGVERLISLNVNGQVRRVDVLPNETLAMTLRYKLGLTGTKLGCDRGECGACTVIIDDIAYNSCSTLTHTVRTPQGGDHRRPGRRQWRAASGAEGLRRRARAAMWLLHAGTGDVGRGAAADTIPSPRATRRGMPCPATCAAAAPTTTTSTA